MNKIFLKIFAVGLFFLIFFGLINLFGSSENNGLTFVVALLAIFLGSIVSELFYEKGEEKINDLKELNQNISASKHNFSIYNDAKVATKYLSDDFLLAQIIDETLHIMKKIAYEEALVERGVIQSSPTHEKLALIKQQLKM